MKKFSVLLTVMLFAAVTCLPQDKAKSNKNTDKSKSTTSTTTTTERTTTAGEQTSDAGTKSRGRKTRTGDTLGTSTSTETSTTATGASGEAGATRNRAGSFATLDANSDSKISRDEWKGNAARFDAMDTDKNGTLTMEEFRAGRKGRAAGAEKSASSAGTDTPASESTKRGKKKPQ